MPKFVLLIAFLFVFTGLQAQTWEIGGQLGGAGYLGDLNTSNPFKFSGPAGGLFVKRNIDGHFGFKLAYNAASIAANDNTSSNPQSSQRNLSFFSHLDELSLTAEFNFFKYIPDAGPNRFTPFIYLGGAITGFNPQTHYQGQTIDLQPLTTEGEKLYSRATYSFIYGAGVRYNFSGKWSISADMGYRNTNTDYLDDVSGYYPQKSKLPSDIARALSDRSGEVTGVYTGAPGSQRGDLRPHDSYFMTMITVSFTFVTEKCYFTR